MQHADAPQPLNVPPLAPPMLSPEQLQQLAAVRPMARRVQRVASVAAFDGWTVAIFAALSLMCGMTSPKAMFMAAGMGVIAAIEIYGAGKLKRLEADAARRLGFNQLGFALLLIIYALWSLYGELHGGGAISSLSSADPSVADMLKPYQGLAQGIAVAVYGSLIAVALAAQGGLAVYYFSRVKDIQAYRAQTPAWIVQMQLSGVTL